MRWVITGASRGIGLEFARQVLERGDVVDAAAREPKASGGIGALREKGGERLRAHALDVASDPSVAAFAEALPPGKIDVVVLNAGIMGKRADLASVDFPDALATFDVNALGALRVLAALAERLEQGTKVVAITSGLGSIGDNTSGGALGYRMSKAALNMAMKSAAVELRPRGVTVVVVNPGWVQTDMGGRGASLTVEKSVGNMVKLVDGLTPEQSGSFLDHSGSKTWPW